MVRDWPAAVLTLTIWTYWSTVFLLVFYNRLRHGLRSGVIPRNRREKRLWLGVGLVFLAWNSFPSLAILLDHGPFSLPRWAVAVPGAYALRCVSAGLAVLCYLATLSCWLLMGRNWSMAIVPGQKTELVTRGLFAWVRHPIYSLSILLMTCSAVVIPTVPMLLIALLHSVNMHVKARNEEKHLAKCHGSSFTEYCRRVGRFVPRLHQVMGR